MDTVAPTELILSRAEAMVRLKINPGNVTGFKVYCRNYGLSSLTKNRYSLRAIDKAIEREVRGQKKVTK